MHGDRRLPFAVEFDQPCVKPQLRSAEANQFLDELKGLLLRETVKEPDKGDLLGKAKPVMRRRHLPSCTKSSPVRVAARLSWSRENIAGIIPRPESFCESRAVRQAIHAQITLPRV
jgi:hypothetical protein